MELARGAGVVDIDGHGAVVRLASSSPLKLLAPKNHGRAAWVFSATLGGGLVDGDHLQLTARVAPGGALLLATQASTKVFPGDASQTLVAEVAEGALLVSLPDPVVCFGGAAYRQHATVSLAPGASLIWLDAVGAGRTESGERWAFRRYASRLRVGQLVDDGLLLDPAHGPLAPRLGRFEALATLIALGPQVKPLRERCLTRATRGAPVFQAASPLGEDGVVVRLSAASIQAMHHAVRDLLPLASLLGDDPFARKW